MQPRHVRYVWQPGSRGLEQPAVLADWLDRHQDPHGGPTVALIDARGDADPLTCATTFDAKAVVGDRVGDGELSKTMRLAADDLVTLGDTPPAVWQRRLIALSGLALLRRTLTGRRAAAATLFNRARDVTPPDPRRACVLFLGAPGPHKLAVVDALLGWSTATYAETVPHARRHLECGSYAAVVLTDCCDAERLRSDLTPLKTIAGPGTPSFVVMRGAGAGFTAEEAYALGADEVLEPSLPRDLIQLRLSSTMHQAKLRLALREERVFAHALDPVSQCLGHSAFHACVAQALQVPTPHAALLAIALDGLDEINRACGFAAGDRALAAAGQALRTGLRAEDVVGRLAGAHLGAWLVDVPDEHLPVLAQRLQAAVRRAWLADAGPALTARVGWTRAVDGDDALTLSRRARREARHALLREVS